MARPALVVNGVSKRYRRGLRSDYGYGSLRESLARAVTRPLERLREARAEEGPGWLLALHDVSFSVEAGETVGIIGRNGAGKSTLLKILSRVTRPTNGWAEVHGRVGALLEVGTGFHPELTGRENVYLNGAILGMRRAEIARRFDEIVAFAEVDDFLDTPVKRYSSGMRVRLAFAVAAHLEPEILIVDEVLAVGDIAFQRKCLGKMGEVTSEGRTVLFVSHNLSVIQSLCQRGVLLDGGRVTADGPVGTAVGVYLAGLEQVSAISLDDRTDRYGWHAVRLREIHISSNDPSGTMVTGARARFTFVLSGAISRMACSFTILDNFAQPVMTFSSQQPSTRDEEVRVRNATAESRFECVVDDLPLVPGRYRIDIAVRGGGHRQDVIESAASFDVAEGLIGDRPVPMDAGPGPVVPPHAWTVPVLDG